MKVTIYKGLRIITAGRGYMYSILMPCNEGPYGSFKTLEEAKKTIRSWRLTRAEIEAIKAEREAQLALEAA